VDRVGAADRHHEGHRDALALLRRRERRGLRSTTKLKPCATDLRLRTWLLPGEEAREARRLLVPELDAAVDAFERLPHAARPRRGRMAVAKGFSAGLCRAIA